ncbi:MAG: hypothetical protein J7530_12030 [Novosphingobium sp.]|nr:hypothetical protein [Novosphingobium sp.]
MFFRPTLVGWAACRRPFTAAIRNARPECTTVDAAVTAADYLRLNLPDVAAYAVVEGGADAQTAMFPQLLAF